MLLKIGTSTKALIGKRFIKLIIVKDKDVLVKKRKKNMKKLTLDNATEEKREEKITKEIRKEENIREEEDSGFREYKL